jgi:hypothetical protein
MSIFKNITKNKNTRIIFSIIWGLGLASLFQRVCKGRECIVYKAPKPNFIQKNSFKFNDKCYSYKPKFVECKGGEIEE